MSSGRRDVSELLAPVWEGILNGVSGVVIPAALQQLSRFGCWGCAVVCLSYVCITGHAGKEGKEVKATSHLNMDHQTVAK